MTALRRSCLPLAFGRIVWKDAEPANGGVLAYSRVTKIAEMVIIVNPGGTGTVDVQQYIIDGTINKVSGQKYVNVFAPSQVAYTAYDSSKKQATLHFPDNFNILGGSMAVFAHEYNVLPFDKDLQISLCKQEHSH